MKHFLFCLLSFVFVLCSCKTQSTIHYPPSTIIRDSVSVTYRQGKEQPLSLNPIEEQPTSPDVIGAQTDFRKNSGVPADGSVGLGATQGASVFEEVQSARTKKKAVPPTSIIRVDTVFIERWHTQTIPATKHQTPATIPRFYKNCTWGFFLLILLFLGRIAFRIFKAIYH